MKHECVIHLFGPLRGLEPGDLLCLPTEAKTIDELLTELEKYFSQKHGLHSMMRDCAIANSHSILYGDSLLEDRELNLLPPVCGG